MGRRERDRTVAGQGRTKKRFCDFGKITELNPFTSVKRPLWVANNTKPQKPGNDLVSSVQKVPQRTCQNADARGYSGGMIEPALVTEDELDVACFHVGDGSLFGDLFERYAGELLAFLSSRVPNRLSADVLAQNVWLKVWSKRTDYHGGNFRAWLYQIARNELIDACRKKYPERLADGFDPMTLEFDSNHDWLAALRTCLDQVEGTFVEMIRCKSRGHTTDQLVAQFGISPVTVATRIHRGKQLLKDCVRRKNSMNLIALDLPDNASDWPPWLESQLVGLHLRDLVQQLELIAGPNMGTVETLADLLGSKQQD